MAESNLPMKISKTTSQVPEENTEDNIYNEIRIDITVKKENPASKIDKVSRFIKALMNTDGGEIKLVNIKYDKAEPKNFDLWLGNLEKDLGVSTSSRYLEWHCDSEDFEFSKPGKQFCKTEKLYLGVKPKSDELFTVKTYLYMPRMTDVVTVKVEDAFEILNNTDFSHTLRALPPYSKEFGYGEVHHDARNESDTIQLKGMNETGEVSNIPNRFSAEVEKYLPAFCNHSGGRIFFGINDKSSKVVGVKLTEEDKKKIEENIMRKMKRFLYGYTKKPVRKDHWDIEFHEVAKGPKMEEGKTLEVIVVSVSKFPGGVFTAPPVAYYVDVNGWIKQYPFEAWIKEIKRRRNAKLCDRFVFSEVCSDPQYNNPGLMPTNAEQRIMEVQSDVKEIKSDVKENRSDIKENRSDIKEIKSDVKHVKSMQENMMQPLTKFWDRNEGHGDAQFNNPVVMSTNVTTGLRSRGPDVDYSDEVPWDYYHNVFPHHDTPKRVPTKSLENLEKILLEKNCVTVRGYIGTGKSTLAVTVALSMKGTHNVVWKVDCSTDENMSRCIRELSDYLKCKVGCTYKTDECILSVGKRIVDSLLHMKGDHLLIFEDVTEKTREVTKKLVETYLLGNQGVKVIVTSTMYIVGEELHITGFTDDEAIKFCSVQGTKEDKLHSPELRELCEFYCNNPLGLVIARQYIHECRISIQEFLRILKEEPRAAITVEDEDRGKPLFKSIFLILEKIYDSKQTSVCHDMLLLKYFNAEEIPVLLLQKAISFLSPGGNTTDVNDVLLTMNKYAFATISGKDNDRVLQTHSIILQAFEMFDVSALKRFENRSKYSEVVALLKSLMCLINKDNRMDLKKHLSILPHAVSILKHAWSDVNLNEREEDSRLGNAEFLLPLLYVADLVGYTFDFKEMHVEGEKYYEIARKCFHRHIDLTSFDINTYDALDDIALRLIYRKMMSTYKNNKTTLNKIGKEFVLNKFRSKDEIELLKTHLPVEGPFLENQEYENLCRKSLAVPDRMIGKYVFFEVVISFLYSYGRRTFYTSKERKDEILRYRHYLLVAYHLCKIFHAMDTKFIMIHQMLTRRNGYIQEALLRNLEEDEIEKLMAECMDGVNDKTKYYLFGTLYLDASSDAFSKALWLKQLVSWYCKRLENVNKDDSEKKRKIISEGRSRVEELLEEIRCLKTTSAFPGFLLVVGEFYKYAEAYDDARKFFHEITSLVRYEEEQYPRHQRLAYVGIVECNLSDSETKLEDLRESISTCSKTTLGYRNEQEKLETVLFNCSQPDASEKQYQACIEYLSTRLSYLDNDTLCIDKKVMTEEISELWKKLETMNVQGSCQAFEELRRKMKNLTV